MEENFRNDLTVHKTGKLCVPTLFKKLSTFDLVHSILSKPGITKKEQRAAEKFGFPNVIRFHFRFDFSIRIVAKQISKIY